MNDFYEFLNKEKNNKFQEFSIHEKTQLICFFYTLLEENNGCYININGYNPSNTFTIKDFITTKNYDNLINYVVRNIVYTLFNEETIKKYNQDPSSLDFYYIYVNKKYLQDILNNDNKDNINNKFKIIRRNSMPKINQNEENQEYIDTFFQIDNNDVKEIINYNDVMSKKSEIDEIMSKFNKDYESINENFNKCKNIFNNSNTNNKHHEIIENAINKITTLESYKENFKKYISNIKDLITFKNKIDNIYNQFNDIYSNIEELEIYNIEGFKNLESNLNEQYNKIASYNDFLSTIGNTIFNLYEECKFKNYIKDIIEIIDNSYKKNNYSYLKNNDFIDYFNNIFGNIYSLEYKDSLEYEDSSLSLDDFI